MSAALAMGCLIHANGRSFILCAYHVGLSGKLKAILYVFPPRDRLWDSGSLIQVTVVDKTDPCCPGAWAVGSGKTLPINTIR